MDNNIQEKELEKAAGGISDYSVVCKSCGKQFVVNEPEGTILYVDHGCTSSTSYYKCPYCGFQWEED